MTSMDQNTLIDHPRRSDAARDYLWLHLRDLPFFRALLRAVEARFYRDISLPEPTLDLGCGDGHFATVAFDRPLAVGVDPWWEPLREAAEREAYRGLTCAAGAELPFPDEYFASAVSNSVLEHIPEVEAVLKEAARVLKPGAPFVFCVPNHRFLPTLSIGRFFDRVKLKPLGKAYRAFFNRISRHYHCDAPEIWEDRLAQAGFQVEEWWDYFSPAALRTLEWGHYLGLPSWVSQVLFGRWILSPTRWNLALTERLIAPYFYEDPENPQGAYTFYRARRL
jgi:SAM-dependent methyltransferase